MGIPSYFSHIVRRHRKIIKEYNRASIDNLYMDCNSIIYDAVVKLNEKDVHISKFEYRLIKEVCIKINEYITLLNPIGKVMIAFDGVAPVAKLDQQRNRRYKSAQSHDSSKQKWNTVAITPGTKFMSTLGKAVKNRFKNAIVSGANEIGEGEHKIYAYIRENPEYHRDTTTVIYGLDADLIMLTLNHLHIAPKMFLFRETPEFIKTIDRTLKPNANYLLDIPEFRDVLEKDIDAQDYIFLCFFLGNDFLPHFPALNIRTTGIDRLLSAYRTLDNKLTSIDRNGNPRINWKHVKKLVQLLADHEETMIQEEYTIREKQAQSLKRRDMTPEEAFMSTPLKDRRIETYINPSKPYWQERYYSCLFHIRIDDDRRREISLNYLEGLEWTFKYYSSGCVDWRWRYRYHYPPLLEDLTKYIPYFDTTLVPLNRQKAVTPYVQLSYVLPGKFLYLLPKKMHEYLLQEHPEWYRDDYEFCWAFCRYFWEAHALLPVISIKSLETIYLKTRR